MKVKLHVVSTVNIFKKEKNVRVLQAQGLFLMVKGIMYRDLRMYDMVRS